MTNKLTFKQAILAGILAALTAAVINAVLFFIFQAAGVFTADIEVQPGQSLSVIPVIISSILPTLIASLVFFLIERYTQNGYKSFKILAVVLLLLSFLNPFLMIPNVTVMYGIILNVMHIVVVLALLYFIKKAYHKQI